MRDKYLHNMINSAVAKVLTEATWNYHKSGGSGEHNGKPYVSDNKFQMSGRGTGHFGSGTYFSTFKEETPQTDEKYGDNSGDDRPQFIKVGENVYRVDIDFYKNLYRVYTRKQGNVLFTLLKHLNSMYYIVQYEGDTSTLSQYYQIVIRNAKALKLKCPTFRELWKMILNHIKSDDTQSFSTVFMEYNGYNGVNVSGVEGFDNTTHGSVIYDLSKTSGVVETPANLNLGSAVGSFYDNTMVPDGWEWDDLGLQTIRGKEPSFFADKLNEMPLNQAMRLLKNYTLSGHALDAFPMYYYIKNNQLLKLYLSFVYNKADDRDWRIGGGKIFREWFTYKSIKYFAEVVKRAEAYYWLNYLPEGYKYSPLLIELLYQFDMDLEWGDEEADDKKERYLSMLVSKMNRRLTEYELREIEESFFRKDQE